MIKRKPLSDRLFPIFCLIIVGGLGWLVWNARTHPDEDTATGQIGGAMQLTISETKANELLVRFFASDTPISEPYVRFLDGKIAVGGIVRTSAVLSANVAQQYPELSMLQRILAPNVTFTAEFEVGEENGAPTLRPSLFRLDGYPIPLGLLPRALSVGIGDLILAEAGKVGFVLSEISVRAGELILAVN